MKIIPFIKETTHLSRSFGMDFGWGNGYVGVTKDHPLFGIDYEILNNYVNVHGGLTYSGMMDNMWCFGFDTAHSGDTLLNWPETAVAVETGELYMQIAKIGKRKLNKIVWDSKQTKMIT